MLDVRFCALGALGQPVLRILWISQMGSIGRIGFCGENLLLGQGVCQQRRIAHRQWRVRRAIRSGEDRAPSNAPRSLQAYWPKRLRVH